MSALLALSFVAAFAYSGFSACDSNKLLRTHLTEYAALVSGINCRDEEGVHYWEPLL